MSSSIKSTGRLEFSTVWEKGEEGTEAFGCFGLCVTANNDVLAFCEGRIGWRDYDPQHLFCKRSTDGGRIWGKNKVLCESRSGEIFHNPTPVVDRESGLLFAALSPMARYSLHIHIAKVPSVGRHNFHN